MRREDKTGLEVETLTHYLIMALDAMDLYGRVASYDPVQIEVEEQDAHVGYILIMDDGARVYPDSLAYKVDKLEKSMVGYLQEDRLL
jgi:hypothetical protein